MRPPGRSSTCSPERPAQPLRRSRTASCFAVGATPGEPFVAPRLGGDGRHRSRRQSRASSTRRAPRCARSPCRRSSPGVSPTTSPASKRSTATATRPSPHLRRALALGAAEAARARSRRRRPRVAARRRALAGARRMNVVHVDELDAIAMPDGFVWRPVRRRFDIRAFGVNAYSRARRRRARSSRSTPRSGLGHEEIYLVLRGRARFTIDGNEHELGAGELVFVRDPALRRGAVALDADTIVLALGGEAGRGLPRLRLGGDVRGRAGRAARGLGRGDPRCTSRRSSSSPTTPACSTTSPAWRHARAALRRAGAPEARRRARSVMGAARARTPTSPPSATSPAFPRPSGGRTRSVRSCDPAGGRRREASASRRPGRPRQIR